MDPRSALLLTLLLPILLLTACEQGKPPDKNTADTASAPATTSAVPAVPEQTASVPVIDPNLAFKGEELYNQNCVFCHQADAIGKPGVAPSLTNKEFLAIAPVDFLVGTIRDGRPGTGMPPFAHLGEEKINAIVAFLRSHATLPSRILEVDAQPHTQGDPRLGKQWFDQVCATCHGPEGNGYAAGGTGTAIGKAGFLNKVSDGFIRTTVKEGRSNTRMLPFQGADALADLTDNEIDDIIAYLRTVPSKN
jgi:cytochrome c oxidase cbb3-type subunit 3